MTSQSIKKKKKRIKNKRKTTWCDNISQEWWCEGVLNMNTDKSRAEERKERK